MTGLIYGAIGWLDTRDTPAALQTVASGGVHSKSAVRAVEGGLTGKVVKVSDGDTVTVLVDEQGQPTQLKVRLLGIDAPEKSQPFGEVCRKKLADQIAGKGVTVWQAGKDRYGRTIGKILLEGKSTAGQGLIDINLEQVKSGCAWHYKQYSKNQPTVDRDLYSIAEKSAQAAKLGLWSDPRGAEPPWDYRRDERADRRPSGKSKH